MYILYYTIPIPMLCCAMPCFAMLCYTILKFLEVSKFHESFQFVVCVYLKLILWFVLMHANDVKHVNMFCVVL